MATISSRSSLLGRNTADTSLQNSPSVAISNNTAQALNGCKTTSSTTSRAVVNLSAAASASIIMTPQVCIHTHKHDVVDTQMVKRRRRQPVAL